MEESIAKTGDERSFKIAISSSVLSILFWVQGDLQSWTSWLDEWIFDTVRTTQFCTY